MPASLPFADDPACWPALDADAVLRGQGADPAVVRARGSRLVEIARRAVEEGVPLLEPRVMEQRHAIDRAGRPGIRLLGGPALSGDLVGRALAGAREIVVLAVTVGEPVTLLAASRMRTEPALGLALDGLANAAVVALATARVDRIRAEAHARGWGTGIQLSPGMAGWPLERGQRTLFALLPADGPVRLSESGTMFPRKSLSMMVGVGSDLTVWASTCDLCSSRDRCRHRGRGC